MAAKSFCICCVVALVATQSVACTPIDDGAKKLLLKSMDRAFKINVRAVIDQRCLQDGVLERLEIEQSFDGQARYRVLSPISSKGIEQFDDGNEATTYIPERNLVLIQASSRKANVLASRRLQLAEQNYSLTMEPSPKIAGRRTICVKAKPNHAELQGHRYYLDSQTGYLLRAEVLGPSGKEIRLDTLQIMYPAEMDSSAMKLQVVGASTVHYSRQWEEPVGANAAEAGFSPLIPTKLPLGFEIQSVKLSKSKSWKAIVVRVTDGLVQGTVYEWMPSSDEVDSKERAQDRSSVNSGAVRLLFVADIPRSARESVLRSFVNANVGAQRLEIPKLEPISDPSLLPNFSSDQAVIRICRYARRPARRTEISI